MPEVSPTKYLVTAGWDDAPHLSGPAKERMLRECEPHLRDARSKGIPSLGVGAVYPLAESEFVIDPIPIPPFWRRGYGLDVGWNKTAAIWGALDGDTDTIYLTTEHYRGQVEPAVHAEAIKARGEWMPGKIDPAANGRSQVDGEQLMATYRSLGLNIDNADNAVEAGIYDVWMRLSTGRLKVFSSCVNWLFEYRRYHRDKNGKIVRLHNHLMDATRYLCRPRAIAGMKIKPVRKSAAHLGSIGRGDTVIGY